MLFNSLTFAIFLPVVFVVYWMIPKVAIKLRNIWLIIASYVFYGWWDWRFLSLIIISSSIDFAVGKALGDTTRPRTRKLLLGASIFANLGMLGFFKYFGFFAASLEVALSKVGLTSGFVLSHIILPVGISFYTFQTLSYTIDIYRQKIEATEDVVAFFAFVSFFPQLVAGPIERAASLLPQFSKPATFDRSKASDGVRQALWGLFKKTVIADNLAPMVEATFAHPENFSSVTLVLGATFFAIQIYADFSGYSDIAIGIGKLFGFELRTNFLYPYFSRNIREFWSRWHISLSTWFGDYVYVPLGGSRTATRVRHFTNILITFVLSGLWHGANWTFLCWGLVHGLMYAPVVFSRTPYEKNSEIVAARSFLPSAREFVQLSTTFAVTLFAWVFFRADNVGSAFEYLMMTATNGVSQGIVFEGGMVYVAVLITLEWIQRRKTHCLEIDGLPKWFRWVIYYCVVGAIFAFGATGHIPFIYFQF